MRCNDANSTHGAVEANPRLIMAVMALGVIAGALLSPAPRAAIASAEEQVSAQVANLIDQ